MACLALAVLALLASGDGAEASACKCFVPVASATYSTTAPGSNPDINATLDLGLGPNGQYENGGGDDTNDYSFGGFVHFSPSAPTDAGVPDGALVGSIQSTATLGLLNNPCASRVEVPFQFMEGTTDINDVVHMLPFGQGNELAVLAGDNPPFEGQQATKPPPAVTHYPSYLNAIFDPDWVDYGADKVPGNADDNNGPLPPSQPRFRAVATTWLGFASLWIIAQQVVFEPGTDLPSLPNFDPAWGYPSVTVLQTSSAAGNATPPIAGPITDFCSPLKADISLRGVSGDNPDTAPNEGGFALRTLPSDAGTPVTSILYAFSQRDADGDGYENTLDPCPVNADLVWNPRDTSIPRPGDSDMFIGFPSPDGIPDSCDPTPTSPSGSQPTDHDDDGIPNSGDNCPVVANPEQQDTDLNAATEVVGDGIGDACDPNPATPDGAEIVCMRVLTVTVGGPATAAVSDCVGGPTVETGGYFHPVTPCRILDTRPGPGKLGPNSEAMVDVTGACGVPDEGVSAIVLNTTVAEPSANSFLTIFPSGVSRPTASNLNFVAGQTVPNLVTVKVGADGYVKVYNAVGETHVIFDLVGWYGGETDGSRFNALAPARILDTRDNPQGVPPGPVDEGETVVVDVTGVGGVPPDGVTAVVLNTTVTQPTSGSFLTVFPSDATLPLASNLNFGPGQTVPNLVIVKVGAEGTVTVYNKLGSVHVVMDVAGWYGATGDLFQPLTPCRNWDTRPAEAPPGPKGKVGAASSATVDVTGVCHVPSSGASAVVVNATVTEPTAPSYLTVYPSDAVQPPLASNLNFGSGRTVPNLVIVRTGPDVKAYNAAGETHALFDVVGYFAPEGIQVEEGGPGGEGGSGGGGSGGGGPALGP